MCSNQKEIDAQFLSYEIEKLRVSVESLEYDIADLEETIKTIGFEQRNRRYKIRELEDKIYWLEKELETIREPVKKFFRLEEDLVNHD